MVKLDRESIYYYKHRKLKKNIGILGGTFDPPSFWSFKDKHSGPSFAEIRRDLVGRIYVKPFKEK